MARMLTPALKTEYASLWAHMEVRASKQAEITAWAKAICSYKDSRYLAVEKATGVPWWVVGILHAMEAGLREGKGGDSLTPRFDRHLHNGDPMYRTVDGKQVLCRTVTVPAGHPKCDSWTWSESAVDALKIDGLDKVPRWSLEGFCFAAETYNGWGSRAKGINTPYLWSYSNNYSSGKFVRDHVYDPKAVSGQMGAMPLLKAMMAIDPGIKPVVESQAQPVEEKVIDASRSFPKAAEPPGPIGEMASPGPVQDVATAGGVVAAGVFGLFQHAWDGVLWLFDQLPGITNEVQLTLDNGKRISSWFSPDPMTWVKISAGLAAALLLTALLRRYKGTAK